MTDRSPITTHVLDTSLGRPADGVAIVLHRQQADGSWEQIAAGATDADGRLVDLLPPQRPRAGVYRLTFAVRDYFQSRGESTIFPEVCVAFEVSAVEEHYHVPLLLSPYGYSTYRGS